MRPHWMWAVIPGLVAGCSTENEPIGSGEKEPIKSGLQVEGGSGNGPEAGNGHRTEGGTVSEGGHEDAADGGDSRTSHDGAHDGGCPGPYLGAPIFPPALGGGIDLYGGPDRNGSEGWDPAHPSAFHYSPSEEHAGGFITLAQAEAILCAPEPDAGSPFVGVPGATWANGALSILYDTSQRVSDLLLATGYEGAVDFASADGTVHYKLPLDGTPITATSTSGAAPLTLDWSSGTGMAQVTNTLYDALRSTFQPSLPSSDCVDTGQCVIGNNQAEGGYLWMKPLHLTMFVATTVGSDTENSAFVLLDLENPGPNDGSDGGDGG